MPRWRSAIRATRSRGNSGSAVRRSSTTKSFPAPCILVKRRAATASVRRVVDRLGVDLPGFLVLRLLGVDEVALVAAPCEGERQQRERDAGGAWGHGGSGPVCPHSTRRGVISA